MDFNAENLDLIDELGTKGSFVVACNHDMGHSLRAEWWDYAVPFLLDHPYGVDPEPYADGLPDDFPTWCSLAE